MGVAPGRAGAGVDDERHRQGVRGGGSRLHDALDQGQRGRHLAVGYFEEQLVVHLHADATCASGTRQGHRLQQSGVGVLRRQTRPPGQVMRQPGQGSAIHEGGQGVACAKARAGRAWRGYGSQSR